jgi:cytochrome c553
MKPATFLLTVAVCLSAAPLRAADVDFFEKKIRPLLVERCYSCHGNGKQKGGLSLVSRESLLKGGESGPVVVPGHPEQSRIVEVIRYEKDTRMPPKGKLPDDAIADLIAWIEQGAPWPPTPAPSGDAPLRQRGDTITAEDRAFWSFQPIGDPPLPTVRDAAWAKKPLDRFVLARLEAEGLRPVRAADKHTLLRRTTFDLTGLPPTPGEIDAFLADEAPDAFARVVDRLLASPHYGERWSRHWLDIARYGEDQAHNFQPRLFPNGYRYRDWVVGAFNDDLPYDRFVVEQIAGDLLTDGPAKDRLPALGFFALGPHYYGDSSAKKLVEASELDDRLDTLCRGLLGLTVACARCHDHKFDPIPTKDYYSLAGVFQSTKYQEVPFAPADVVEKYDQAQARIKQQDAKIKQLVDAAPAVVAEHLAQQTARYMIVAWKLHSQRPGNTQTSVAEVARKEKLVNVVLDRWMKYLFDAGSEKRPHLARWREALAGLDAKKDLSNDAAALEQVTAAAMAFQEEVLGILRERDDLLAQQPAGADAKKSRPLTVAGLDKAKADVLQELLAPTGVCGVAAAQAEALLPPEEQKALAALRAEQQDLKKTAPPMYPTIHTIAEASAADMKVYQRGDPDREGEVAPRRFLRVLAGDEPPRFTQGSGRLELARAIASKDNPLTARVIVNRVWQHHFGKGLVGTPSNFGRLGQRPTHPELLDHLATGFIAHGWSLKWLHREILLSATYQLSCADETNDRQVDPANRLLWRMNRQRLDVEAWRDALLAASGRLDTRLGGPPSDLAASANNRRTLYGSISRHNLNSLLRLFDFPDPNLSSEQRTTTTVPLQQLFVLNSDFMIEQARVLVKELTATASDDAGRIRAAFVRLYGRPATEREVELGMKFLAAPEMPPEAGETKTGLSRWEEYAQVLLSANEFTFVD